MIIRTCQSISQHKKTSQTSWSTLHLTSFGQGSDKVDQRPFAFKALAFVGMLSLRVFRETYEELHSRTWETCADQQITSKKVRIIEDWVCMYLLNFWFKDTSMKFDPIQEFQIWNHNSNQTFKRISQTPGWNMEGRLHRLSQLMDLMISHWEAHLPPKMTVEWADQEARRGRGLRGM